MAVLYLTKYLKNTMAGCWYLRKIEYSKVIFCNMSRVCIFFNAIVYFVNVDLKVVIQSYVTFREEKNRKFNVSRNIKKLVEYLI